MVDPVNQYLLQDPGDPLLQFRAAIRLDKHVQAVHQTPLTFYSASLSAARALKCVPKTTAPTVGPILLKIGRMRLLLPASGVLQRTGTDCCQL